MATSWQTTIIPVIVAGFLFVLTEILSRFLGILVLVAVHHCTSLRPHAMGYHVHLISAEQKYLALCVLNDTNYYHCIVCT